MRYMQWEPALSVALRRYPLGDNYQVYVILELTFRNSFWIRYCAASQPSSISINSVVARLAQGKTLPEIHASSPVIKPLVNSTLPKVQ